ncbi:hypothetical protein ACFC5Z_32260 [Streptomyces sp. NPDC056004]|uniref:hypothetical protein n=1 Tax=Streptomyces sp. NPDC056004 TaxID=3345677 RepID=UPI0035D8451B
MPARGSAEERCEDTITVQTRNQVRHLLVLDYDSVTGGDQNPSIPAVDSAFTADPGMTGPCGIRSCSALCLSRTGAAAWIPRRLVLQRCLP